MTVGRPARARAMGRVLYRAGGPVTLVGAGPVPADLLARALALAPEAVAADGGGNLELPDGRRFGAVIGDLDSLTRAAALRAAGVPVHEIPEQDTTDLQKCLYAVDAPQYLGVGFLGGRTDHHMAAMSALVTHPGRRVVLVGRQDVCFLCPERLELDLAPGTRVSLFPMAPARGLVSEGLRWPVAGLRLAPDGRIGTSNVATGGRLRLGFDAPKVVVILPVALFETVAARLLLSR